jgi:adenosine deaminase/aminodeoxyfutalosine deaminase
MRSWIEELEKAELHVHLEGAVWPETLCEIDPSLTLEEVERRYRYADFAGFLEAYKWVNLKLRTPAHFALAARRLFEYLHGQNVRYAEVNLSVGVWLWRGLEFEPVFAAIHAEAGRAPLAVRFIFDAVRQFGAGPAWDVARLAEANRARGVAGVGIGGDESRGETRIFREVFAWAAERGLWVVPHAGETCGPESVWQALECGARRIGHGIRAIGDPVLVAHLRDHRIPLEVAVSSNLATGAAGPLAAHPLRRLYDAGVPITLNTDDPPMFATTLNREYEIAAREFGFDETQLRGIAANGFEFRAAP